MALEIYYPADIRNALLAADHAATADADSDTRFIEGYRAALMTLALAFGLGPELKQRSHPLALASVIERNG